MSEFLFKVLTNTHFLSTTINVKSRESKEVKTYAVVYAERCVFENFRFLQYGSKKNKAISVSGHGGL
jgi:hypothetical protein